WHLRAAQGVLARCAVDAEEVLEFLLPVARRPGVDGASRQSVRNAIGGRFGQWRVAQLHVARRAPS
ncbi:hypothetical protein A2U01_0117959, partial [Trifolium medium]|nr:hypothetical protein [Trifolium medium]